MLTDVLRERERESKREALLDTWKVFELLRTEVSGPLKNPREENCEAAQKCFSAFGKRRAREEPACVYVHACLAKCVWSVYS
jgi:hypothetical protein